jgi:hypothetical protein
VRVALDDAHVQVVQTLAHDVQNTRSNFGEVGVLIAS